MCNALDDIHNNHIIHRDIKTANILMKDEITVNICDFGCAHQITSGNDTTFRSFAGTPFVI
jgi:serine/threonine protein kinase